MAYPDVAIHRHEDDRLKRGQLIDHLVRMLIDGGGEDRRATRLSIGLIGPWGSGKSSVLRMLSERLSTLSNVLVVEFNPWVFQGRDDLITAFFEEVAAQFGRMGRDDVRAILEAVDKYRGAIEPTLKSVPGGEIIARLVPRRGAVSAIAERRVLEKRLKAFRGAVVVLVDELDRVEQDEIRSMARLIKAVGDLPNISYLISYDRARVEAALGNGDQVRGAAYLEKIVQFPIPLRPLVTDEVRELLDSMLTGAGYDPALGDRVLMDELLESMEPLIDTLRDVKRLVSSFAAMEPMVAGEVHKVDVLGYTALCTKGSALRDKISDDVDLVVNDPASVVRRMERSRIEGGLSVQIAFGQDVDPKLTKLITFLFPALDKSARRDSERFGRIQDRRNLLTMLFLGDPPFQTSRKEILEFWNDPSHFDLAGKRDTVGLSDFNGLVYRLMPELPSQGDPGAWIALAAEVGRGRDSQRVQGRYIGRELIEILMEFGARGEAERTRARTVVAHLITAGDFELVPEIVRHHMFAHGLVKGTPPKERPTIWNRSETIQVLETEVPRYRALIESGGWLDGGHDTDAAFVVMQNGAWDSDLRGVVEAQLEDPRAIVAFAALMFPPGWTMGQGTVEQFVSEDGLRNRMKNLRPVGDRWFDMCVSRLSSYLQGRDPEG
jgi:hypothetical protein